jgi:hypothetical protein
VERWLGVMHDTRMSRGACTRPTRSRHLHNHRTYTEIRVDAARRHIVAAVAAFAVAVAVAAAAAAAAVADAVTSRHSNEDVGLERGGESG